jgi:hypothetical protein
MFGFSSLLVVWDLLSLIFFILGHMGECMPGRRVSTTDPGLLFLLPGTSARKATPQQEDWDPFFMVAIILEDRACR